MHPTIKLQIIFILLFSARMDHYQCKLCKTYKICYPLNCYLQADSDHYSEIDSKFNLWL
jgi:hypothetical protein